MELDNGYVLLNKSLISYGRHSRVFEGLNNVVVKIYKDNIAYERELCILKQLHNKASVPEVLCSGNIDKSLKYIVQPRYDITLHDCIQINGNMSIYNALYLLHELVVCLEEIHSLNIVHRDIKPSNIMLHKNSIVIIDFSLSIYDENEITKSCVGSPLFMSINAHTKKIKKYTYHDDLESAYYTFLYCYHGNLPWSVFIQEETVKKEIFKKILSAKKVHDRKFKKLCQNGEHEEILLEIEEFYKNKNTSLEYEQKNFYEKFTLKNSHNIF